MRSSGQPDAQRPEVRTLCLVLAHTGCRLSEALALTAESIDLSQGVIVVQTLKQRGTVRFRSVPVPGTTLNDLKLVQRWIGHRSLETTIIYMDIIGAEERQAADAMWD